MKADNKKKAKKRKECYFMYFCVGHKSSPDETFLMKRFMG